MFASLLFLSFWEIFLYHIIFLDKVTKSEIGSLEFSGKFMRSWSPTIELGSTLTMFSPTQQT